MIEKVALLGEAQNLVGIRTEPGTDAATHPDLAFILLNAGLIHRIGPGRLNVKLARRLAAEGFVSLRLDLSGIGDSRPLQGGLSPLDRALADVRAVMDGLEASRGKRRFALVGLCSGADLGFAAIASDERVVGVAMIDPIAYPTWKTRLGLFLMGLRHPRWLARALGLRFRRMLAAVLRSGEGAGHDSSPDRNRYVRPSPPLADFAAGLACLSARGGSALAVYSGSSLREFNHPRQLDDVLKPFGAAGLIDCRLQKQANHAFTSLPSQARLIDSVVEWARGLSRRLTPAGPSPRDGVERRSVESGAGGARETG